MNRSNAQAFPMTGPHDQAGYPGITILELFTLAAMHAEVVRDQLGQHGFDHVASSAVTLAAATLAALRRLDDAGRVPEAPPQAPLADVPEPATFVPPRVSDERMADLESYGARVAPWRYIHPDEALVTAGEIRHLRAVVEELGVDDRSSNQLLELSRNRWFVGARYARAVLRMRGIDPDGAR